MKLKVCILCSGVGLGVYIPALVLRRDLGKKGISARVFVFESILEHEVVEKLHANKAVFQTNYQIARMAYRLPSSFTTFVNNRRRGEVFQQWNKEEFNCFVLFSGHWLPLLSDYNQTSRDPEFKIECCYLDSSGAPSWNHEHNFSSQQFRVTKLFDAVSNKVNYSLNLCDTIIDYGQRQNTVVAHGGGWLLGDYDLELDTIYKNSKLKVIVLKKTTEAQELETHSVIYQDESWTPWTDRFADNGFPPIILDGHKIQRDDYHPLYHIISNSVAILSKPGGMSLVDSFSSATPILFTDGLPHENSNMSLWINLKFGIKLDTWLRDKSPIELLRKLHLNLKGMRDSIPSYCEYIIKEYSDGYGNFKIA